MLQTKYIVVHRNHGELMMDTKFIGPFDTWHEADDHLSSLPAVGYYDEKVHCGRSGVKYVQELIQPGK